MSKAKWRKYQNVKRRSKYQFDRSGKHYKRLRNARLKKWLVHQSTFYYKPNSYIPPHNLPAPKDLSFLEQTDKMLDYLNDAREYLKHHQPVTFDISQVESMTPDSIPILISHITNPNYNYRTPVYGNAPLNPDLKRLFKESGFYDHVRTKRKNRGQASDLMHKESNFKVKPEIAGRATRLAVKDGIYCEDEIEALYNIFIELMSNTHHHANVLRFGLSKWWLYVCPNKITNTTSICFLDLGVGIFNSIIIREYFRRIGKKLRLINNIDFIDDLISGKIGSRVEADNEIRGKGIPQISENAQLPFFQKFCFITNNVKVDMKSGQKVKLKNNFHGTFYYIELCPSNSLHGNQG